MLRAGVTAIALVLALAVGAAAKPAPNVRGVLVRPAVPACPTGEPCDPPPTATFLVFSRAGRVAARVRVGAGGGFALHLRPGTYSIRAAPPPLSGRLRPAVVRVPRVGVARLRLVIR